MSGGEEAQFVVAPEQTFDALYGLRHLETSDESARGEVPVRRELMQPWGLVHGGVYAAMAESLASWATALAVAREGRLCATSRVTIAVRPRPS